MTGNLAVAFGGGSSYYNVAVFEKSSASPKIYQTGFAAQQLGYDNGGNLFVLGFAVDQTAFADLPYGSQTFERLTLKGSVGGEGRVQWDGHYITIENQVKRAISISRVNVAGSAATVVGVTRIKGPAWATSSWIAGDRVVLPYSSEGPEINKIGIWRYPKSGKALVSFGKFEMSTNSGGVTVSIAPGH
jgi:hypothetical protein